jgi:hypothetical protein
MGEKWYWTMQDHDSAMNGSAELSPRAAAPRRKPEQRAPETLDDMRFRLDAVIAAVERLERQNQGQQALSSRKVAPAAIVAAAVTIFGLLGLIVLGRVL